MSTITDTGETVDSDARSLPESFTDWSVENTDEPTAEQEREAREHSLAVGNETEIGYEKAPEGKQDYYERLDKHNRDNYWGYREDVNLSKGIDDDFKRHILYSVAGQLGLPDLQRRKAMNKLFQIRLSRFGYRLEIVAFCICAMVAAEEHDRYDDRHDHPTPYNPQRNAENNDRAYDELESRLMQTIGVATKSYFRKVWGKLNYGNPPVRDRGEWVSFVADSSPVQTHPSHRDSQFGQLQAES